MKKLTIEESFSEIQKAIFIMNKGQNFQKFAVFSSQFSILYHVYRSIRNSRSWSKKRKLRGSLFSSFSTIYSLRKKKYR